MFCETCGKKLIRGYSFCMDCGTPVPPGAWNEDNDNVPENPDFKLTAESESMPGIAPMGGASVEGGMLSSGSGVPMFNTDNTGLGGIGGLGVDENQAVVNLFGSASVGTINSAGFNSPSANIDMPSIEAPSKTSQAKQKEPEKGQERLLNDFAMTAAAGDETLEVTDKAVKVLSGVSMDNTGADIDLSPYKFLDNQLDMSGESENPTDAQEETKPEEPAIVVNPVEEATKAAEPKSEEIIAPVEEAPKAAEPKSEEIIAPVEEAPKAAEPKSEEIIAPVEEAPKAVEPKSEEIIAPVEEAPKAAEPKLEEIIAPVEEAPKVAEPKSEEIDDFIPEEMNVIEESSPFVEEVPEIKLSQTAGETNAQPKTAQVAPAAHDVKPMPEPITAKQSPKSASTAPLSAEPVKKGGTATAAPQRPVVGPNKAKTIFCRKCGQAMAEDDAVCKSCGTPYKAAYTAESIKAKQPKKLFGVLPVSAVVVMASIAVIMTALIIFLAVRGSNSSTPIDGELSVDNSSQSSSVVSSSSSSSTTSTTVSSSSSSEPVESSTSSDELETSTSEPVSSSSSSEASVSTSTKSSSSSTSKPQSSSSSKKPQSTSSKSSSSSKPASSSSSSSTASTTLSSAASAQEFNRRIMADSALTIYAEIGKVHTFAQMIISIDQAKEDCPVEIRYNMTEVLKAGYNDVQLVLENANSASGSFGAFKSSIDSLYDKYKTYYKYVMNNSTLNQTTCNSYYIACEQAMGAIYSNQFSSAYNANDKSIVKKSMSNSAVSLVNPAYSKLVTLRNSFTKISLNYAETAYTTLATQTDSFMSAVKSTYMIKGYSILMGGDSSISSGFDKLNSIIRVYINLCDYAGKYDEFYNAAF